MIICFGYYTIKVNTIPSINASNIISALKEMCHLNKYYVSNISYVSGPEIIGKVISLSKDAITKTA